MQSSFNLEFVGKAGFFLRPPGTKIGVPEGAFKGENQKN
jgi:hypothetical protein